MSHVLTCKKNKKKKNPPVASPSPSSQALWSHLCPALPLLAWHASRHLCLDPSLQAGFCLSTLPSRLPSPPSESGYLVNVASCGFNKLSATGRHELCSDYWFVSQGACYSCPLSQGPLCPQAQGHRSHPLGTWWTPAGHTTGAHHWFTETYLWSLKGEK